MLAYNAGMDVRGRIRQMLDENPEWSPRSISLKAGLSDSMLTKFLNPDKKGGIQSVTLETLEKIAEAMGVNARWLAFGDYPRKRDPKIAYIWDRIAERDKERALRVLETFTEDESKAS